MLLVATRGRPDPVTHPDPPERSEFGTSGGWLKVTVSFALVANFFQPAWPECVSLLARRPRVIVDAPLAAELTCVINALDVKSSGTATSSQASAVLLARCGVQ